MIAINIENLKTLKYHIFLKNIRFLLFIREIFIYRSFLVLLKLDQNTKSKTFAVPYPCVSFGTLLLCQGSVYSYKRHTVIHLNRID